MKKSTSKFKTKNNQTITKLKEVLANTNDELVRSRALKYIVNINNCNIDPDNNVFRACKSKFCHTCNNLKTNAAFAISYSTFELMQDSKLFTSLENYNGKYHVYHLTLTIKNPSIDECENAFNNLKRASAHFLKSFKILKQFILGYQVAYEVSQGDECIKRNELNPHVHIVLILKPEFYNSGNLHSKVTQLEILKYWNACCSKYDIEANTIRFDRVVQKVSWENTDYPNPYLASLAHVYSYSAKLINICSMDWKAVESIILFLHGERMTSTSGLLRKGKSIQLIKYKAVKKPEALEYVIFNKLQQLDISPI